MQFWARNFFPTLTAALALVACGDKDSDTTTTDAATTTAGPTSGDASTSDSPTTAASTSGASNSGSTSGDASTSGDPPTTGEPASTSGPDGTTTDATASSTDPGTTGDVAQCLMMIEPGDACGECACNNCLADLQACQADEGCTAIRMCAQENMCSGVGCLIPCGPTIEKYGGVGGKSGQLGLALSGCIDANCADQCG